MRRSKFVVGDHVQLNEEFDRPLPGRVIGVADDGELTIEINDSGATYEAWPHELVLIEDERPEHAATRQRTNDEEEYVIGREADMPDWERELLARAEDPFEVAVERVFRDSQALLLKKHLDYGPKNISDSPGGPLNGLLVRMHDKMARLKHLTESGADPQNESVRDTVQDLGNYAVIYQLVLDGDWPA